MLGSEGVTEALTLHLRKHVPRTVAALRTARDASTQDVPDVHKIYPVVKRYGAVGQYPAIFVEERETTGRIGNQETDAEADYDEHSFRYHFRLWVWATADTEEQTGLLIKRITQAVETALLQDKLVFDDGRDYAAIDPGVIRHSYSDVAQNEAKKMLGGSYIDVEVVTQEKIGAYPDFTGREQTLAADVGQGT